MKRRRHRDHLNEGPLHLPRPIAVRTDFQLFAHARSDGKDIVFSAAGVALPSEIVKFDTTSGALEAWVRLPSLGANTTIAMDYGGPLLGADPMLTWSDLKGAWHVTNFGMFTDSTMHHHDASGPSGAVAGIAGSAGNFQGAGAADFGDPADGSLDASSSSFSVSVWVRVTSSAGALDTPLGKGGTSVTATGYTLTWNRRVAGPRQRRCHQPARDVRKRDAEHLDAARARRRLKTRTRCERSRTA
ncbi:MAG: hypothetical protein QM736_14545 [Vicinamibacterales bacterium]